MAVIAAAPAAAYQTDPGIAWAQCGPWSFGTDGNDNVALPATDDDFDGLGGADQINGGGGNDCLFGSSGGDIVDGADGNDVVAGGAGPAGDMLLGGPGNDDVDATEPPETEFTSGDVTDAGDGDDDVKADDGFSDTIDCGPGQDRVDVDVMDSVAASCELRVDLEGAIDEGPLEADQSAITGDETSYPAAAPAPVSASGQAGSYTRELWSEEEVGSENGLSVISSTAAGTFALTGLVLDGETDAPIQGATVELLDPSTVVSATTDASGSFAFVDVPPTPDLTLEVSKTGYGSYTVNKTSSAPDETFVTTVELGPSAQTYDDSTPEAESTLTGASAGSGYDSDRRVPPSISVALYPQASDCSAGGSLRRVRRYPWRFYVLHTMSGEIFGSGFPGGAFRIEAAKAVAQAIQSYAWYHRIRGGNAGGGADVDNTTRFQCFKPHRSVRRSWRTWVNDITDERIADSNNNIQITQYRAGTYNCTESAYPANGNILSQLGSKAREEHVASATGAASPTTTTPEA